MNRKDIYAGLVALSTLASAPAFAASIVNFTFDAGNATLANPHDIAANPDISNITPWSVRDGVLSSNGLTGKPNSGRAIGATSFGAAKDADPEGNEFRFSFDVHGRLALTGFSFWEQGSSGPNGTGPTSWEMFVNGGSVATGAGFQGNPGLDHSGLLNLGNLTGTVNVSIFAKGAVDNPLSLVPTATWRIDNFILEGTVAPVPLPASLPMLIGALGMLGMARRRRA